jgi:hypothetical protein
MKQWLTGIFILAVTLSANAGARAVQADYNVVDQLSDFFLDKFYARYGLLETIAVQMPIGLEIPRCDIQYKNIHGQREHHYRSGLVLCAFEHLARQIAHPDPNSNIVAWVRLPNREQLVPFRVNWKTDPLPRLTRQDFLTSGFSYISKLRDAAKRWKNSEIILEPAMGPLPITMFVSEDKPLINIFKQAILNRDADSQTKVSRIVIKVTTSLKNEPIAAPCTAIDALETDQSRICIQTFVYGNNSQPPSTSAIAETNWTVKGQSQYGEPPSLFQSFVNLFKGGPHALMAFLFDEHARTLYETEMRDIKLNLEVNPDERVLYYEDLK